MRKMLKVVAISQLLEVILTQNASERWISPGRMGVCNNENESEV